MHRVNHKGKAMKTFFSLLEELTPDQKETVDKWGPNTKATEISKDVFPEGHDRIEIPLHASETPVEAHPAVKQHLESNGYQVKDYRAGIASDKAGRDIKIGKVLERTKAPDDVKKTFANDPNRATSTKDSMLKVVISKHPHDVAGMSTDRGWKSCMTMGTGCNQHYLKKDVEHGTHVAYLVHKDDDDINFPISRIALKPFVGDKGHQVIRPEETGYGTSDSSFHKTVNDFTEKHYPLKDFAYTKHESVYDDDGNRTPLINIKSESDVMSALKHENGNVRSAAAMHKNLTSDLIDKAMTDKDIDDSTKKDILRNNDNVTSKHLSNILDNKDTTDYVKTNILGHPELKKEHILRALDPDQSASFARIAARSAKYHLDDDVLDKVVNHKHGTVREIAAVKSEKLKPEHLNKLLKDENIDVRALAYAQGKLTDDQLSKVFKDKDEHTHVKMNAARNLNLKDHHVDYLLDPKNDTNKFVTQALLQGDKVKPKHIDKLLDHEDSDLRYQAITNFNANKENAIKAITDSDSSVSNAGQFRARAFGVSDDDIEKIVKSHNEKMKI